MTGNCGGAENTIAAGAEKARSACHRTRSVREGEDAARRHASY